MSVNNPDKLDALFKKLEEDIENGKFLEYLKEIDKKGKERKEYVNHKEFFEWLAEFIDKLHWRGIIECQELSDEFIDKYSALY